MRLILLLVLLTSCSRQVPDQLTLLVCSRGFDTSSSKEFIKSYLNPKTPADVGHAWIHITGTLDDKKVNIEGGHSGERGTTEPKFFEGFINLTKTHPNPICYLHKSLQDGFFQKGSGGFSPTYALRFKLSKKEIKSLLDFISPSNYYYTRYNLNDHQCTTFVKQVAAHLKIILEDQVTINLEPYLVAGDAKLLFYTDDQYSKIQIGLPDVLEKSLKTYQDKGEVVTHLYQRKKFYNPIKSIISYPKKRARKHLFDRLR